jgi:hypothetical protein
VRRGKTTFRERTKILAFRVRMRWMCDFTAAKTARSRRILSSLSFHAGDEKSGRVVP